MKMDAEKKKTILLDSFDIIKDNYINNQSEICEIIGKMFKIDINIATDMWLYILNKHNGFLKTDSYCLADGIIYAAGQSIGEEAIANIVIGNEQIKKACFGIAEDVSYSTVGIIRRLIKQNQLTIANELLLLVNSNLSKSWRLYDVIEGAIPFDEEITEEAFDLINTWIERVDNKEERAKLNVKILEFVDDE